MSKEWQEATNERAIEQKLNPITGAFLGTLFVGLFLFPYSMYSGLMGLSTALLILLPLFFLSLARFGGWNDSNANLCFLFC
jgi:hypothetical protein